MSIGIGGLMNVARHPWLFGASLTSMRNLGQRLGYTLVHLAEVETCLKRIELGRFQVKQLLRWNNFLAKNNEVNHGETFSFCKLKFKPTNNVCRIRELQMFFSLDLIWLFISSLVDPRWVCLVDCYFGSSRRVWQLLNNNNIPITRQYTQQPLHLLYILPDGHLSAITKRTWRLYGLTCCKRRTCSFQRKFLGKESRGSLYFWIILDSPFLSVLLGFKDAMCEAWEMGVYHLALGLGSKNFVE